MSENHQEDALKTNPTLRVNLIENILAKDADN